MPTDYRALPGTYPLMDRIKAALTDSVTTGGVPAAKAASLIALSVNEGGAIWGTPRSGADLWMPDTLCSDYRQIIGWESGSIHDPLAIPDVILQDAECMQYLASRGGVDPNGNSRLYGPFFHGFQNGQDCVELARFFEWAVDRTKVNVLKAIALGPTQINLQFSKLFTDSASNVGGNSANQCFPQDWDSIWALYNAPDAGAVMDLITYLDPICTGITTYPADHPDDDQTNLRWLGIQTGGNDFTMGGTGYPASYYTKGGVKGTMYSGWLDNVLAAVNDLGISI